MSYISDGTSEKNKLVNGMVHFGVPNDYTWRF
jgi:hypothetical protein